uniref:Uncharacterized protein n=1 Tax=Trypanosoma congolense (strain IL3000) TaxID=1068625 RepID=G0USC6_TRYCI|nr:conserved hypothetical protein [Trypanosoma congolense IL3000]
MNGNLRGPPAPSQDLQEQLAQVLRVQIATEECIARQGELVQQITYGFAVLREWATHAIARVDITLHDLLLAEAFTEVLPGEEAARTVNAAVAEVGSDVIRGEESLQVVTNSATAQLLLEEAKQVYATFVRKRLLDASCPEPDDATQFHALTEPSFSLLLPHLIDLLEEFVMVAPNTPTDAQALGNSDLLPERRAALCRLFRFAELGVKHFSQVITRSKHLPRILVVLSELCDSSAEGTALAVEGDVTALRLSRRAAALRNELQCLCELEEEKGLD